MNTTPSPTHTFQAVWPVIEDRFRAAVLFDEAAEDLSAVASRHGALIVGKPDFRIRPGRLQPGSQGAEWCVVATAPARPRANRRKTLEEA